MSNQLSLFGLSIDALTLPAAVERLLAWTEAAAPACRYVVTPNVDHAVMFQTHAGLRSAYADAGMVLADGMPVVWAARLLGRSLPERVTGSDLVPALFTAAQQRQGLRVFLLGAAPGVGAREALRIGKRWPAVRVVGTYSPPLGFERSKDQNADILARIAAARPDVLVVGLGAPKQELWVHAHRAKIAAPVALCVGATIDFLAGERRRAPTWMRKTGLEWLHRLAGEPRRLLKRYARDAWIFPRLVARELFLARD
jgi:N-acetylglucosaminyldiphosphoundecaprenol N-acetyl-beta-D-mannosaminyltransferase